MDYDPDGVAIMSTYKLGSRALPHENHALVVPGLRWLGITMADLRFKTDSGDSIAGEVELEDSIPYGALPLTTRDRKKAVSMLSWGHLSEDIAPHIRRELQIMLMLGMKAEIQIVDESTEDMAGWISRKLKC